jgi:hypothetical protein
MAANNRQDSPQLKWVYAVEEVVAGWRLCWRPAPQLLAQKSPDNRVAGRQASMPSNWSACSRNRQVDRVSRMDEQLI